MERKPSVKMWRDVLTLTYTVMVVRGQPTEGFHSLVRLIYQHFGIEQWSQFSTHVQHIASRLCPMANYWRKGREQRSVLDSIFEEERAPWQTTEQNRVITMTIVPGVTIMLEASQINSGGENHMGVQFRFNFGNPKLGTSFREAVRKLNVHDWDFVSGEIEWENAIWIQFDGGGFTKGHGALLGARLSQVQSGRYTVLYRLVPSDGEQLVVYGDRGITTSLGLEVPYKRQMVRHPNDKVFASIGPFSMHIDWDNRRQRFGRPNEDQIVVFTDDKLPIQPDGQEESDEDGIYYDDEPPDRFDPEY